MIAPRQFTFRASKAGSRPRRSSQESGFAYLMALFMVLVVIIASQVALQNLATEGRRLREQEMIWRGEQCKQAVKLYYRKSGHYPQTLDDLQKGLPELHFLRSAAYKDPMNRDDGSWRLIYVNASGQIIGSVRYATLQQMALLDLNGGKMPAQGALLGAAPVSGMASAPGQPGQNLPDTQKAGQSAAPGQAANPLAQLKPTGPVDGPVLGAFLTGVASKVDRPSVRVYKGGKKYIEWEFIWNPIEDQARAVQKGLGAQGAQPGQPGQPIGPGGIGTGPPGGAPGFGGAVVQPPSSSPAPQQ
jgi:hypothetical protein